ncbi:MAG: hypothetical protein ACRD3R_15430, partial [Terriglobales bacterium]
MTHFKPEQLQPPDDFEDRVVARLRAAGLFNRPETAMETSMKAIHMRWALAATVLLAAGVWAGTQVQKTSETAAPVIPAVADARPVFALMLYEDARYETSTEDEYAARVAEYSAWARKLAAQGNLVDGAELLDRGVMLHRDRPRSEAVPTGTEGLLAGYFVIRADSLEEAERIA